MLWCSDPYRCSDILRRWFIHGGAPVGGNQAPGRLVVVLSATLVFIPIPLSNVVPALVIALISLAYLEEDGVLSLDRLAGRRHLCGRDGGSLADGRRRKMDHRSLVATCRW
ncbi:hypothetical protein EI171_13015 [Bradyrhizobium sp. LCT2]|uniref:Uncharacterized protein n=1 Tax=Bradyrhizobium arachidis TaxID=858423 RepID=A0AAE7NIY8_9BRAD|nr:hypothetical protein EI171_13015 [Bradyrhizobium sp. LCT2]QOZ66366.1 hypothetical protein WN72_08055 [Bradyrhizobium arachidis]